MNPEARLAEIVAALEAVGLSCLVMEGRAPSVQIGGPGCRSRQQGSHPRRPKIVSEPAASYPFADQRRHRAAAARVVEGSGAVAVGLRRLSPQEVGTLTLIEPVLNPLWAYLASPATETPTVWTLAGGACIVGALVWRYWPLRKEAIQSPACRG